MFKRFPSQENRGNESPVYKLVPDGAVAFFRNAADIFQSKAMTLFILLLCVLKSRIGCKGIVGDGILYKKENHTSCLLDLNPHHPILWVINLPTGVEGIVDLVCENTADKELCQLPFKNY